MNKTITILAMLLLVSPLVLAQDINENNVWGILINALGENCFLKTQLGMTCYVVTSQNELVISGLNSILENPTLWEILRERNRPHSTGGGSGSGSSVVEEPVTPVSNPYDYNGDGKVNGQDIAGFNAKWDGKAQELISVLTAGGEPTSNNDYNGDGTINNLDVNAFNSDKKEEGDGLTNLLVG